MTQFHYKIFMSLALFISAGAGYAQSEDVPLPPGITEQIIYDENGNIVEKIYFNENGERVDINTLPQNDAPKADESASDTAPAPKAEGLSTTRYKGGFFSIVQPKGFEAIPSLPSRRDAAFDSVRFVSQNGAIEFYIYAPELSGSASDILLDANSEAMVDETPVSTQGKFKNRWWSIAALNQSYVRSYHERLEVKTGRITIFGVKFRNRDEFNAYLPTYREFKKSLQLF